MLRAWGKGEENEGSEVVLSQIWKGLKPTRSVGFFLKAKGEPLKHFKQGTDSHLRKIVMAVL